jgi:hypothetical protein
MWYYVKKTRVRTEYSVSKIRHVKWMYTCAYFFFSVSVVPSNL